MDNISEITTPSELNQNQNQVILEDVNSVNESSQSNDPFKTYLLEDARTVGTMESGNSFNSDIPISINDFSVESTKSGSQQNENLYDDIPITQNDFDIKDYQQN